MFKEWQSFKAAMGITTNGGTPQNGFNARAPDGIIQPTGKTLISGSTNRWRYAVSVQPNPFNHKLSAPADALATSQTGYNFLEIGNTSSSVWGNTIVTSSPACGDITAVVDAHTSYANYTFPAWLYWTWFESNDPDSGYYAWWFCAPNMLTIQGA